MAEEEILKKRKLEFHPIVISQDDPGIRGVEWKPFGTNVQEVEDSKCKGAILSGHVHSYSAGGGAHGYEGWVIVCLR